jgi:hypothetical protein
MPKNPKTHPYKLSIILLITIFTHFTQAMVQSISLDPSLLQADGKFTENSLPKFLAQAFNEKKLTDKSFSKQACLKAKSLGDQYGDNTLQLFLVTSTCDTGPASMYIVKESRNGVEEAANVQKIENVPGIRDIIAPKVQPGLPTIALPLAYITYPDKNTLHYIAVMPSAKGKTLGDIIATFNSEPSDYNKERVKRAFHILGSTIANFHKKFSVPTKGKLLGNTIAHGDFHPFNLFFDEIGGHFTFIDNETMEKAIQKRVSPSVDIGKLFFMPESLNGPYQLFRIFGSIDLPTWITIAVQSFVTGYANAYKNSQQNQVYNELKNMFNQHFDMPVADKTTQQEQTQFRNAINQMFKNITTKK